MALPENLEPVAAWKAIRAELRQKLGDSTYEIWIAPLEVKAFEGRILLLTAPPATGAWVSSTYAGLVTSQPV